MIRGQGRTILDEPSIRPVDELLTGARYALCTAPYQPDRAPRGYPDANPLPMAQFIESNRKRCSTSIMA